MKSDGYFDDTLTLAQCTDYLRQRLAEFPFSEKKPMSDLDGAPPEFFQSRSLAVQIAAMLSQFVIGCVPRYAARMGFIYNANTERSGKTLLCKLAIIPVNGKMAVQTWTKKEEDLRKAADAEMLRGARAIVYDNVRGHIQSQVIEALMTSATWTGRVLGRTEMFEAPNNATVFLTGNDCTVSPDMAHRCLVCDLFVEEADVQEHQVKDPISDVWLMRREKGTTAVEKEEEKKQDEEKGPVDRGKPKPSPEPQNLPGFTWSGEVPAQKWMNFYTRVLAKFSASTGMKLTVRVEIAPEGGVSKQKIEETKKALGELGLQQNLDVKTSNESDI